MLDTAPQFAVLGLEKLENKNRFAYYNKSFVITLKSYVFHDAIGAV